MVEIRDAHAHVVCVQMMDTDQKQRRLGPHHMKAPAGNLCPVHPPSSLGAQAGELCQTLPQSEFHLLLSSLPSKASECAAPGTRLSAAWPQRMCSPSLQFYTCVRFYTETVQVQPRIPFCCLYSGALPSL